MYTGSPLFLGGSAPVSYISSVDGAPVNHVLPASLEHCARLAFLHAKRVVLRLGEAWNGGMEMEKLGSRGNKGRGIHWEWLGSDRSTGRNNCCHHKKKFRNAKVVYHRPSFADSVIACQAAWNVKSQDLQVDIDRDDFERRCDWCQEEKREHDQHVHEEKHECNWHVCDDRCHVHFTPDLPASPRYPNMVLDNRVAPSANPYRVALEAQQAAQHQDAAAWNGSQFDDLMSIIDDHALDQGMAAAHGSSIVDAPDTVTVTPIADKVAPIGSKLNPVAVADSPITVADSPKESQLPVAVTAADSDIEARILGLITDAAQIKLDAPRSDETSRGMQQCCIAKASYRSCSSMILVLVLLLVNIVLTTCLLAIFADMVNKT
ncbi:hypothetical protein BU15DRAFT_68620 [Melanogaster broomeanus]|nr:hypothetical protein BU15DRAFT_68620 [Melanogaster broomeanus]